MTSAVQEPGACGSGEEVISQLDETIARAIAVEEAGGNETAVPGLQAWVDTSGDAALARSLSEGPNGPGLEAPTSDAEYIVWLRTPIPLGLLFVASSYDPGQTSGAKKSILVADVDPLGQGASVGVKAGSLVLSVDNRPVFAAEVPALEGGERAYKPIEVSPALLTR